MYHIFLVSDLTSTPNHTPNIAVWLKSDHERPAYLTDILEVLGTALLFTLWIVLLPWQYHHLRTLFWLGTGVCSLGNVPSRKYNDGAPDDSTEIYVLEEGAWGNFARGAVLALRQRGHKLSKVHHFHATPHLIFAILDHCKYLWNCELLPWCNGNYVFVSKFCRAL
jgi:hypothetical protein